MHIVHQYSRSSRADTHPPPQTPTTCRNLQTQSRNIDPPYIQQIRSKQTTTPSRESGPQAKPAYAGQTRVKRAQAKQRLPGEPQRAGAGSPQAKPEPAPGRIPKNTTQGSSPARGPGI